MNDDQQKIKEIQVDLAQQACQIFASDARVIFANEISVEDKLANMCQKHRCENCGLSASCPPYVSGPAGFRKL